MPGFIVRVELPGEVNYSTFHERMQAAGFVRWIASDQGVKFDLPHATYYVDTGADIDQVRRCATDVAHGLGLKAKIVVVRSAGTCWNGLDIHEPTLAEILGLVR